MGVTCKQLLTAINSNYLQVVNSFRQLLSEQFGHLRKS